ncbi:hypothetical protein [Marinibactrum halimedae]|uniref:Uncharacterized protein n=1 Tax=Marinibactrum halimedae TaxID=1444977 RepID=A0AA37T6W9_9GAMM|nr:hypothetical protein [Marinibactrum halimedae]MCD9459456.1 hypothetical protein [Marinibactrum halimedae]GLS28110.1 hypothetical protein GCM10007877_38290 [Marinibactrum halimedae]
MSKIKLGIGLYSCPTSDHNRVVSYIKGDDDVDKLIVTLDQQLKALTDHIKAAKIPGFGVQGIFVAPEYMFSAGDGKTNNRGVDDYMKDKIVEKLKKLSLKYSNIVFIPGSICWQTSALGQGVANISMGGTLSVDQAKKAIPAVKAKQNWQNPVANKVGFAKDLGSSKASALDSKKATGDNVKAKFQKNTVFIFHQGKLLGEHSKSSDYDESNKDNVYHVADPYPGLHQVKTHKGYVNIGIEVCLDHDCDTLYNWVNDPSGGNQKPHLHVIASAAVQPKRFACKANGYFLHASSHPSFTMLYDPAQGKVVKSLNKPDLLLDTVEMDV